MAKDHSKPEPSLSILNFISDDIFRSTIAADYVEMDASIKSRSWKCAVVMAGSIIEALLVQHLITDGTSGKTEEQILNMQLGAIIQTCKSANVISTTVESLSVVVRDYRNLLHAGRIKRLEQTVTEHHASVAVSLVAMIANELAESQLRSYGFTAEQVLSKLQDDPTGFQSAYIAILPKLHEVEKRKLLLNILPDQYSQINDTIQIWIPNGEFAIEDQRELIAYNQRKQKNIIHCFSSTYASSGILTKREVNKSFLAIIRFSSERRRMEFERAFYSARYALDAESPEDMAFIIKHLFSLLANSFDESLLRCTQWLGQFLLVGEDSVINQAVRLSYAVYNINARCLSLDVQEWAFTFFVGLSNEWRQKMIDQIRGFELAYKENAVEDKELAMRTLADRLANLPQSIMTPP